MPEWHFPISPISASRPRIARRGAYFAGPYKIFRQEMQELVPIILGNDWEPLEGALKVDLELFVTMPKKTKLTAPKADIDNYVKAILDSANGKVFIDDDQIKRITAVKRWEDEHGPRIELLCVPTA